jgi:hypothetical protein
LRFLSPSSGHPASDPPVHAIKTIESAITPNLKNLLLFKILLCLTINEIKSQ